MGLVGILLGLALLMWLAYRGWSVLMVAPVAALLAAAISGEPLLAHWTQTFMPGAGRFVTQWFPMFLLGGLFGKLMDDSGSITSIARFLTERLGTRRTILSVVLASAAVTYGGVSVFVAFFVLVPMAKEMFQAANIPRRLMPATIGLGAFTFTMSAMPGTPSVNNAIPMPYFGTTTFAAPGLGSSPRSSFLFSACGGSAVQKRPGAAPARAMIAILRKSPVSTRMFVCRHQLPAILIQLNLTWQAQCQPFLNCDCRIAADCSHLYELLTVAGRSPTRDFSFLAKEVWGGTTIGTVAGVWSVLIALAAATLTVVIFNYGVSRRCGKAWMRAPLPPSCQS